MIHKTLQRQLSRLNLDENRVPDSQTWQEFIRMVDESYQAHDEDRYLLERSLDVSSTEMQYMIDELRRSSESTMKIMLDSMQNGVITVDSKGTILSYNHAAQNIFGYGLGEVVDRPIKILVAEKYIDQLEKNIQNNFKDVLSASIEVKVKHKDGHVFPLLVMISELPIGNEKRFIISCFDMTQQKKMDEQVRRSQRMDALGKLTGGIAHDYNNLLGVMMGYAELLAMQVTDNEKVSEYSQQIIRAGQRGSLLTKKLLSVSRPQIEESISVDINHVLQDAEEILKKTLTVRVRIHLRLQDAVWPIWIDRSELENAILNLAINAMHAMPDGGELSIASDNIHLSSVEASIINIAEGDYVRLTISDTGHGMNADTLQQVFDPFFTTKGDQGTGLGLSQVYTFMQHIGGGVYIDSIEQQGTVVSLYFPRYQGELVEDRHEAEKSVLELPVSGRILVVDDEPALCLFVSEVLSDAGFTVFYANSAEEALNQLANESVDMMISDVLMPGMDGYQLAEQVRQQYPQVKIQLMSGYTDDRHTTKEDKALFDSLLRKPMGSKEILAKVSELLKS